ncbi:Methylosome subunit pICln [Entomophthora muscae]|uniref:Methylosome subunit pICln n=1 Tax=Entomophthora muscae TaxID=34485 RepID=A0ACC2TDJ9_9FUNG|nr:Methylosome subunit pICln [Entomophthora muscae]
MGIIIERQPFESEDILFLRKLKKKEAQVDFLAEPTLENLSFGTGTLFVHEEFLGFYSEETQTGFKIDYRRVVLHAIALDSASQRKVIYVQLDTKFDSASINNESESAIEEPQDPYDSFSEFRFLLTDPYAAEALYSAISHCQFLHPDFLGSGSESDSEDAYEDAEEDNEVLEEAVSSSDQAIIESNIAHLERALERGMAETNGSVQETEALTNGSKVNGCEPESESI